jgi:hypothetical protein
VTPVVPVGVLVVTPVTPVRLGTPMVPFLYRLRLLVTVVLGFL